MAIVIPQGFNKQKPTFFDALADAGTASKIASDSMLETALAMERVKGFREARQLQARGLDLDQQRLGMDQQRLGMERERLDLVKQDRADEGAVAGGMARAEMDRLSSAIDPEELAFVRAQVEGMSPRGRGAFLQSYRDFKARETIQKEGQALRSQMQDALIGFSRTEGADAFSEPLQALIAEADQLDDEGLDPNQRAQIAAKIRASLDGLKEAAREKVTRDREDAAAVQSLDAMIAAAPPGSAMWQQLNAIKLAVEMGEVKGADIIRGINQGANTDIRARSAQDTRQYREGQLDVSRQRAAEMERHNRATEAEKAGGGTMTGRRMPTFEGIGRDADSILESWMLEGKDPAEFNRDKAWEIARKRADEYWKDAQAKSGGPAQAKPDPLSILTPEERAEYDKLPPGQQERVRKGLGGE